MKEIIKNIIRVVLYIRVSTQEQARHGYSIESQKARLIAFCKEQGYKIVDIYIDEGKSARSKLRSRKELQRMIADANKDKYDRIVIWRLDRWFRNVADYYKIYEVLEANKIDWECSDETYDTYTSNGRLYLNMKLSIAQNESDQTADRIKFNFENMIKSGKPLYGSQCLPVGYTVSGERGNKRVVKDKTDEEATNDMFKKFDETRSIRQVTIYLCETYTYRNFEYESVERALKNTLYYGYYKGNDHYCEPYITKEQFEKNQAYIKRNNKSNTKENDYMFKGMIRCYDCGRIMSGNTHKYKLANGDVVKAHAYRCGKHCHSNLCKNRKGVSETKLESWLLTNFFSEVNKHIIGIEKLEMDSKNVVDNKRILEKLNSKKDRLNELYIEGKITREKYDNDFESIIKQITEIEKNDKEDNKNTDVSKYKKLLENKDIFELYNTLDIVHKRMFWWDCIDYIEQSEDGYQLFFK